MRQNYDHSASGIVQEIAKIARVGISEVIAKKRILDARVEGVKEAMNRNSRDTDSKKHVAEYLGLLKEAEHEIAAAFTSVADHHRDEPDIFQICQSLPRCPAFTNKL